MLQEVTFQFTLPEAGEARLAILDLSGRVICAPMSGSLEAGIHRAKWNARDARGRRVAPGVYVAVLESNGTTQSRRVVVLP